MARACRGRIQERRRPTDGQYIESTIGLHSSLKLRKCNRVELINQSITFKVHGEPAGVSWDWSGRGGKREFAWWRSGRSCAGGLAARGGNRPDGSTTAAQRPARARPCRLSGLHRAVGTPVGVCRQGKDADLGVTHLGLHQEGPAANRRCGGGGGGGWGGWRHARCTREGPMQAPPRRLRPRGCRAVRLFAALPLPLPLRGSQHDCACSCTRSSTSSAAKRPHVPPQALPPPPHMLPMERPSGTPCSM